MHRKDSAKDYTIIIEASNHHSGKLSPGVWRSLGSLGAQEYSSAFPPHASLPLRGPDQEVYFRECVVVCLNPGVLVVIVTQYT